MYNVTYIIIETVLDLNLGDPVLAYIEIELNENILMDFQHSLELHVIALFYIKLLNHSRFRSGGILYMCKKCIGHTIMCIGL